LANRLEVGGAFDLVGAFARSAESRQKDADQKRDNPNDHQQFHQRERRWRGMGGRRFNADGIARFS
jgi:hypothetical protein